MSPAPSRPPTHPPRAVARFSDVQEPRVRRLGQPGSQYEPNLHALGASALALVSDRQTAAGAATCEVDRRIEPGGFRLTPDPLTGRRSPRLRAFTDHYRLLTGF